MYTTTIVVDCRLDHEYLKRARRLYFGLRFPGPFTKFYYLTIFHIAAINNKANKGTHFVPAMITSGTWVHMQALQFVVVDYFEDMGVATDE